MVSPIRSVLCTCSCTVSGMPTAATFKELPRFIPMDEGGRDPEELMAVRSPSGDVRDPTG